MSSEKHHVPYLSKQERLSDYSVGIFQSIRSRKGIKKAIKKGWITINGNKGSSGDFVRGGEELILTIEEVVKPVLELKLEVLYEDDLLAIINKPAGITVSGNKSRTIQNALSYNLKISKHPDAIARPEPIHRLDYPTSGLLLIGKTRSAVNALNQSFASRSVQKTYHAISIGVIPEAGVIEAPIDNKLSKTSYQIIESISSDRFVRLNLVEINLHTGRRHQIRKHLFSIDSPILGDPLYFNDGLLLKGKGLYLHASRLSFNHPITKKIINIESDLPKKFRKIFPGS